MAAKLGEIGAEKLRLLGLLKRSQASGGIGPRLPRSTAQKKLPRRGSFTFYLGKIWVI